MVVPLPRFVLPVIQLMYELQKKQKCIIVYKENEMNNLMTTKI